MLLPPFPPYNRRGRGLSAESYRQAAREFRNALAIGAAFGILFGAALFYFFP